jgi:hypothetical protein
MKLTILPAAHNVPPSPFPSNELTSDRMWDIFQDTVDVPHFMMERGGEMEQIILKTDMPNQAAKFLIEALETEKLRLKYSRKLARKRLSRFERKYRITSEKFMEEWSAEDLKGKDLEYVEWAGEYKLTKRLDERLNALKSIEHVSS